MIRAHEIDEVNLGYELDPDESDHIYETAQGLLAMHEYGPTYNRSVRENGAVAVEQSVRGRGTAWYYLMRAVVAHCQADGRCLDCTVDEIWGMAVSERREFLAQREFRAER